MSVQSTYPSSMEAAFAGQRADNGPADVLSRGNGSGADIPFGVAVMQSASGDDLFDSLDAGAEVLGVLQHTHAWSNRGLTGADGVEDGAMGNVLRSGRLWVEVEDAVVAGAQAFARHTTDGGSNTQKGKFRSDRDGVAQVTTVTPTSANDTRFGLDVFIDGQTYHFEYTSDSGSSATEIGDGFRTAMAADAAFTALVVATGTATLILTGQQSGLAFVVQDSGYPGVLTPVTGTPPAPTAQKVPGARFVTSADAGGLAQLSLTLA